ncbi:uncharacterized protein [Hetaerina americana]|uniref:uncharacterized protein n=1 Tax=Hetaerina americana TaxID=62018 RepID=UPI003A7F1515
MPRQESFKCRLCLGRGGNFTNIVNAKNDAEKVVREAIEELLELKVVRDRSNPWKLCYQCFKTLTDFYMFKRQCRENNLELERQRIKNQEKTKLCRGKVNRVQQITKRKEKVDVDNQEVEIPFCRGEVNHNIKDQDGTSLAENRKEEALNLSSVGIVGHKEECNADIPRKKELGKEVLKFQGKESLGLQCFHFCYFLV